MKISEGRVYTCILHPTDLKENHFAICEQAAKIARRFGAKLHLLHVIEPPASLQLAQGLGFAEFDKPVKEDAQTVLGVLGENFTIPPAQQHVEIGSVKTHVFEKAKQLGCDLIIIGNHDASILPAFLENTTEAIVHHAPYDVLIVHTKIS